MNEKLDSFMTDNKEVEKAQNLPIKTASKKRAKSSARRAAAIALTGFLLGGIAGGTVYGIYGPSQKNVYAAAQDGRTTLLTAASEDNDAAFSQSLDVVDIVEQTMPSIVAISNKSVQEVQNYFSAFGMGSPIMEEEVESQGSGIIIGENDTELLIATNAHVVEDADTLSVSFIDNEVYEATVKGSDTDTDLAVVAVKLTDISDDTMSQIKIATIGSSDDMKVGQQVVAIGNALGYGQSVTTGIVSALNRQIQGTDSEMGFIQTDAAINPGNSGGALLNMKGELIGINSAKLASTEVEGMGYAIPISQAAPIMEELMNFTTREKVTDGNTGTLGIKGRSVSTEMKEIYGFPAGVYVAEVIEGEGAEQAGLLKGYIITKLDGISTPSIEALKERLEYYKPGETVTVTVKIPDRNGFQEETLQITLGGSAENQEGTNEENQEETQQQDETQQQGEIQQEPGQIFRFGDNGRSRSNI